MRHFDATSGAIGAMEGGSWGRGAVEQWVDHPILAPLIGRPPVLLSRQILRNWKSKRGLVEACRGDFFG